MVKYPIIFRTSLAIALGLLAIFIPFVPLKIIFGAIALVIFAINLRRYAVLLIVVAIIFAVVVAARFSVPYAAFPNFGFGSFGIPGVTSNVYPNEYIQGAKYLSIDLTGLDLSFDPSTNTIYIPSSLNVRRNGEVLDISYPDGNNITFRMVIGTKDPITQAEFHTTGLKVNGDITAGELNFNSVGLTMNSSITAKAISINGVGVNVNGTFTASSVKINGTGDDVDLTLSGATFVKIGGVSVNGNLRYADDWTGTRNLDLSSVSGNLLIYTASSNQGHLDIQNNGGFVKINRVKY